MGKSTGIKMAVLLFCAGLAVAGDIIVPVTNNLMDSDTFGGYYPDYFLPIGDQRYNESVLVQNLNASVTASYVPYSGASQNVDLGNKNLTTTGTGTFEHLKTTDDLEVADDILLGSGSVMNWNSGGITLTHYTTNGNWLGFAGMNFLNMGASKLLSNAYIDVYNAPYSAILADADGSATQSIPAAGFFYADDTSYSVEIVSPSGALTVYGPTTFSGGSIGVGGTNVYFDASSTGVLSLSSSISGDVSISFEGDTNTGRITWMEDEDRFDILDNTNITRNLNVVGDITTTGTGTFDRVLGNGSQITNVDAQKLGGKVEANLNVNQSLYFDGESDFGAIGQDIKPASDVSYNLGDYDYRFSEIFVNNVTSHDDLMIFKTNTSTSKTANFLFRSNEVGADGGVNIQLQQNGTTTERMGFFTLMGAGLRFYADDDKAFIPYADNQYSLGTASNTWANVYAVNLFNVSVIRNNGDTLQYVGTTGLDNYFRMVSALNKVPIIEFVPENNYSRLVRLAVKNSATNINGMVFGASAGERQFIPESDNAYNLGATSYAWKDLYLDGQLITDNACGITSGILVYEQATVTSDTSMPQGNGNTASTGTPMACAGVATAISGSCAGCSEGVNEIAFEVRVNGVSQTCDTPQVTAANVGQTTSGCTVAFSQNDLVGCYTKTETGAATGARCSIYVRFD